MSKPHVVKNRNQNFPVIYYCVGEKYSYLFTQEGGYDYNGEVAGYADIYGSQKAIEIEQDMQRQDRLMDEGKIPYTMGTFSQVQMDAKPKSRPANTETYVFESKDVPYNIMEKFTSNHMQNLVEE